MTDKFTISRKGKLSSSSASSGAAGGAEGTTEMPTPPSDSKASPKLDENGAVIQPGKWEIAGENVTSIFGHYSNTRGVEKPTLDDLENNAGRHAGENPVHFIHRDIMPTIPALATGRLPSHSPGPNADDVGRVNPYEEGYAGAHTAYASQDKIKGHFKGSLDAFNEGDTQTAAMEYISGQRGLLATDQEPRDVLSGELLAHCLRYQQTALGSFMQYGEDTFVMDYGTNKIGDRKFLRKKIQHLQLMLQLQGELNNGQLDSLEEALMQNGQELQTLGFEEIQFINSVTDKLPDAIEEYEFTQQRMEQEARAGMGQQGFGREGS